MFAGSQRHFPIAMGKTFPPIQFNNALETEVVRQITHSPRHYANFRVRQTTEGWFVEMVEMRMC
jgi:hypothetical protein